MAPLLAIGLGALAGNWLTRKAIARRGLGSNPNWRNAGMGSVNYANGVHYAQNAQVYLNRGDVTNAVSNIAAAYKAAGLSAPIYRTGGTPSSRVQTAINIFLKAANVKPTVGYQTAATQHRGVTFPSASIAAAR
jgi:hypothetical protein